MTDSRTPRSRRALGFRRVGLAWIAVLGVDLLFNAGIFAPLFDQAREPALLPDDVLVQRIPIAYATLAVAVAALAWLLDASRVAVTEAIRIGAAAGLVLGATSLGGLWSAIDITGQFVLAGITVSTVEGGIAAAVLTSRASGRAFGLQVAGISGLLAVLGQVVANLR